MGRTRPLLQQIIMGVKINLAKWSDALLETSNCFSLILLPPPRSLRAANDSVVGAAVTPRQEGAWGLPSRGCSPSGAQLSPENWPLSWLPRFLQGPPPSPGTPSPLPRAAPGTKLCSSISLHLARSVGNCWEGKETDPFSLHPDPPSFLLSTREPCPLNLQHRHTDAVKETHRTRTDRLVQVDEY